MKLYFHGCMSQQDIKFDGPAQASLKLIQDLGVDAAVSAKKGFGMNKAAGYSMRQSLYRSENSEIRKQIGNNKLVWQVMTPFELDSLVNANWYKRPSTAGSGGVADMRKK